MIPFVCKHHGNAYFTFAFIHELLVAYDQHLFQQNLRDIAAKALCPAIIRELAFSEQEIPAWQFPGFIDHGITWNELKRLVNAEDIISVHRICIVLEMRSAHAMLLEKMQNASQILKWTGFQELLFPYLRGLVPMLKSHGLDLRQFQA